MGGRAGAECEAREARLAAAAARAASSACQATLLWSRALRLSRLPAPLPPPFARCSAGVTAERRTGERSRQKGGSRAVLHADEEDADVDGPSTTGRRCPCVECGPQHPARVRLSRDVFAGRSFLAESAKNRQQAAGSSSSSSSGQNTHTRRFMHNTHVHISVAQPQWPAVVPSSPPPCCCPPASHAASRLPLAPARSSAPRRPKAARRTRMNNTCSNTIQVN
jgi:hypothetical protein